ncbi:ATP-binding protein [Thiocapsa sp.]|uniref:ATP-binding protein n=1 Tax=Thiocapsa sp. TaxID=2024551 RepID=UPI003457A9DA
MRVRYHRSERFAELLTGLGNGQSRVDDTSHEIIGTRFQPASFKVGNEELESWLLRLLEPKINFRFHALAIDDKPVVLLEIGAACRHPVQFQGQNTSGSAPTGRSSRTIRRRSARCGGSSTGFPSSAGSRWSASRAKQSCGCSTIPPISICWRFPYRMAVARFSRPWPGMT